MKFLSRSPDRRGLLGFEICPASLPFSVPAEIRREALIRSSHAFSHGDDSPAARKRHSPKLSHECQSLCSLTDCVGLAQNAGMLARYKMGTSAPARSVA